MTRRQIVLIVAVLLTMRLDSAPAWSLGQPTAQSVPTSAPVGDTTVTSYPQPVDKSPLAPQKVKQMARTLVTAQTNSHQFNCYAKIIERESHWNLTADNPNSTAWGIGQILDSQDNVGTNPQLQIQAALDYMIYRYNTPCAAWAFHKKHRWY